MRRSPPRLWRRLKIVGLVLLGLVVGIAGFGYLWGIRAVRLQVLERLNALGDRLGRPVTIERLQVSPYEVLLGGLHISTPDGAVLHVGELRAVVDPFRALAGDRRPQSLHLHDVELHLPLAATRDGPLVDLLDRLRGENGDASQTSSGARPASRAPPPIVLTEADIVLHGAGGAVVARAAVARAQLGPAETSPSGLLLRASGRFTDGLASLPRTAWSVEATLDRAADTWSLAVDFGEPVPLPADLLPGVPAGTAIELGSLRAGDDGALQIWQLRATLPATAPGRLARATVAVDSVKLAVPGGLPADPGALAAALRASPPREVELAGITWSAPSVPADGEAEQVTVRLGVAAAPGQLPPVERLGVTRPVGRLPALGSLPALPAEYGGAALASLRAALSRPRSEEATAPEDEPVVPSPPGPPTPSTLPALPAEQSQLSSVLRTARELLGGAGVSVVDGELHFGVAAVVPEDAPLPWRVAGFTASLEPREEGLQRDFAFAGRVVGGDEVEALRFDVRGHLPDRGLPRPRELRADGPWLARGLASLHDTLDADADANVGLLLELPERWDGETVAVSGHAELRGMRLHQRAISRIPLQGLRGATDFRVEWRRAEDRLDVTLDGATLGHARATVHVQVERLRAAPRFTLDVQFPRQPCNDLLLDIPPGLIPRLEGAEFGGTLDFHLKSVVDLGDPIDFKLDLTGDWSLCRVVTLGAHVDVERLQGGFVHRIWEKGERTDIEVGPGAYGYVPLEQIPVAVQQAALATEDMAFFRHEGFRPTLLTRAIRLNLRRGRYVYGGSTISQQLVKNLFLSREKTLSRKLEEAIITWHMERVLTKNRILELYLNCIEYGPEIYGIRKASYTYFGVHPSALTPLEGAFLMGLKPAPKSGYSVYKRRRFRRWWRQKMDRIMRRLWRDMGAISEEQYRKASPYVPVFHYPGEGYVRPRAAGIPESALGPPPEVPPLPPRSEGKHGALPPRP